MRVFLARRTMPSIMEAHSIVIAMHDDSAGYAVSPQRVPLALLKDFSAEASDLLRGESGSAELANAEVAIVEGSLALATVPLAAPDLWADLRSLVHSDFLDGLSPRRRKVIEGWQARTRRHRTMRFEIRSAGLPRAVLISAASDFRADDADQWVRVERYFHGEIEDLGGASKPNAHIRLPDRKLLKVETDRHVLRDDKLNRLYKPAMVRITAEYNVVTREYRNARLIEFVEYEPRFDEREFTRLMERGAKAWKGVGDASTWVDSLRGNDA